MFLLICLISLHVSLSLLGPFATFQLIWIFKKWNEKDLKLKTVSWETHLFNNERTERKQEIKQSEKSNARSTEALQPVLIANYFAHQRTLIVSRIGTESKGN